MKLYFTAQQLKPSFRDAELQEMPAIALFVIVCSVNSLSFPMSWNQYCILLAEFVYVGIYVEAA